MARALPSWLLHACTCCWRRTLRCARTRASWAPPRWRARRRWPSRLRCAPPLGRWTRRHWRWRGARACGTARPPSWCCALGRWGWPPGGVALLPWAPQCRGDKGRVQQQVDKQLVVHMACTRSMPLCKLGPAADCCQFGCPADTPQVLYAAHAGDSRAVLVSSSRGAESMCRAALVKWLNCTIPWPLVLARARPIGFHRGAPWGGMEALESRVREALNAVGLSREQHIDPCLRLCQQHCNPVQNSERHARPVLYPLLHAP